jgi:hypothetical protein
LVLATFASRFVVVPTIVIYVVGVSFGDHTVRAARRFQVVAELEP